MCAECQGKIMSNLHIVSRWGVKITNYISKLEICMYDIQV